MLNQNGFIAIEIHGRNEYPYVAKKCSNLPGFTGKIIMFLHIFRGL